LTVCRVASWYRNFSVLVYCCVFVKLVMCHVSILGSTVGKESRGPWQWQFYYKQPWFSDADSSPTPCPMCEFDRAVNMWLYLLFHFPHFANGIQAMHQATAMLVAVTIFLWATGRGCLHSRFSYSGCQRATWCDVCCLIIYRFYNEY
jgi:hypothetical protein